MATDKYVDSETFILYDLWPGVPYQSNGVPCSYNLQGHASHNALAAAYPVGTKFQTYNDGATAGLNGWSTMIYLQVGTQETGTVIAAKQFVVSDSTADPYVVTNDGDSCIAIAGGPVAVAISAITDAYYGWFWCGGVAPEILCSSTAAGAGAEMGGSYKCDGSVDAGPFTMALESADTHHPVMSLVNADTEVVNGTATTADA